MCLAASQQVELLEQQSYMESLQQKVKGTASRVGGLFAAFGT